MAGGVTPMRPKVARAVSAISMRPARIDWLAVAPPGPFTQTAADPDYFRGNAMAAAPSRPSVDHLAPVEGTEELLPEFPMIAKEHPDALFVYPDVILSSYPRPQQLAEFAIKAHLPMMNAFRFFADAGGLMTYGATASEIYTNAAEQVAKV